MNQKQFNRFCASLPATAHVVQWGGADVWKVGGDKGKVFAIGGWGTTTGITFKVTDIAFEILKSEPGLRPAPYLASRGMLWIQHYEKPGLSDQDLQDYLRQSHKMAAANLSKKRQRECGLEGF